MPCVALFEEDDCWYRGTISSCITTEFFEVTFVDFGNSALLPSAKLRPIYQDLMVLPAQVFECCIADVKPKAEWTQGKEMLNIPAAIPRGNKFSFFEKQGNRDVISSS